MSEQMPANVGEDILRIHRVLTRSLTVSIQFLQQAEQPDNLHHGFMLYLRALSALLHAHHLGEDEIGFPFWRTKSPFAPLNNLIRDHLRMMPLLEKIEIWLNSESGWEAPHLRRLQGILEELNAIWLWHIQLEESVMGPEKAAALFSPAETQQFALQLADSWAGTCPAGRPGAAFYSLQSPGGRPRRDGTDLPTAGYPSACAGGVETGLGADEAVPAGVNCQQARPQIPCQAKLKTRLRSGARVPGCNFPARQSAVFDRR